MKKTAKKLENKPQSAEYATDFVNALASQVKLLSQENTELKKQVDWLKDQFKLASQRHFGKSSETSASLNLQLFDEKMTDNAIATEVEVSATEKTITYTRKTKSVGRKIDVSNFPKEQRIHDLNDAEKTCACGDLLEKAGEDKSIQIDHIPETFKVIEHITLNYCCRRCETMKSAKKPLTAIPKCMATPGFIAEVIVKKYEQHLPLYRQAKIFAECGAIIPDNTLGNWVMYAAEALAPLGEAQKQQIPEVRVLQADETKCKTLKPNKEGYLWGYHSCDPHNRFILFEYSPSRAAHVPNRVLKDFIGILQTDGYSGYADLRAKRTIQPRLLGPCTAQIDRCH